MTKLRQALELQDDSGFYFIGAHRTTRDSYNRWEGMLTFNLHLPLFTGKIREKRNFLRFLQICTNFSSLIATPIGLLEIITINEKECSPLTQAVINKKLGGKTELERAGTLSEDKKAFVRGNNLVKVHWFWSILILVDFSRFSLNFQVKNGNLWYKFPSQKFCTTYLYLVFWDTLEV